MARLSDVTKARRRHKDLSGAYLRDADLMGADLSGANLESTKMPEGWEFSVRDR